LRMSIFLCTFAPNLKKRVMETAQGQLIVNIDDMSKIKEIRRAIRMLKGVGQVVTPRRKRCSAYELSLRDLDEGRVYEAKDVDDLFKQILG